MSSKISSVDSSRTGAVGAGRAIERVRNATTGSQSEGGPSSGEVQITGAARKLAQLEQLVQGMPAIDEARVAAISQALETGTYKVVPERVADGLLQMEQSLGTFGSRDEK